MKMEKSKALEIDGQMIFGRDRFWLINTSQKENNLCISLEIEFLEGSRNKNITFSHLMFYSSTELDTYEQSKWNTSWLTSKSNFELIEHSNLLNNTISIRSDYHQSNFYHYRISTYDYIIDVIAEAYIVEDCP